MSASSDWDIRRQNRELARAARGPRLRETVLWALTVAAVLLGMLAVVLRLAG